MSVEAGLQSERTRLAWRRTALTVTVVTVLGARLAWQRDAPIALAGVLLLWLATIAIGHRRVRALALSRPAAAGRSPWLLAGTIIWYAVIGATMIL